MKLTLSVFKNPVQMLDQLRRSSLSEFEHLKKDEHPNPPLRALPEHSILEEESTEKTQAPLGSSQPSKHDALNQNDEAVPGAFPSEKAFAERDFASDIPSDEPARQDLSAEHTASDAHAPAVRSSVSERYFAQEDSTTAEGKTTEPHFSTQDFTSGSSSTYGQEFSSSVSQHSADSRQSSQHHSLSSGEQIQAGNTTFTVPGFGENTTADAEAATADVLSPTQSKA